MVDLQRLKEKSASLERCRFRRCRFRRCRLKPGRWFGHRTSLPCTTGRCGWFRCYPRP